MHRLWTFGTAELEVGGEGAAALQPKRTALLAYLLLARPDRLLRREALLGLFWPAMPQDRARGALRQALYDLRRHLGPDVVLSVGDDAVRLREGGVWCDAAAFSSRLEGGRRDEALELYRGEFLSGLRVVGADDGLERWIDLQRRGYRRRARDAALALSARAAEAESAVAWAARAHALDPHGEPAARALLEAHMRAGEPEAARRALDRYRQRLREDLGREPGAHLEELLSMPILSRSSPEAASRQPITGVSSPNHRLAVLPFAHSGPRPSEWVGDALPTLLSAALDGAGPLVSLDPPTRPSPAASEAADVVVTGSVVVVGDEVQAQVVMRWQAGTVGEIREDERGPLGDLLSLVDRVARRLLSRSDLADAPFAEAAAVTTASLPALKAFLRGESFFGRWRIPEAITAYQEAVERDPSFTLAFYRLGVLGHWLHDMERSVRAFAEAARGLDRLPRRDRLRFQAMLAFTTGRVEEAERRYHEFLRDHPSDIWALTNHGYLLVRYNPFRGRSWQEARPVFRRALELAPGATLPLLFLSTLAAATAEMDESRSLHVRLLANWRQEGWPEYPLGLRAQHAFLFGGPEEQGEVLRELDGASELIVFLAATVVAVTTRDPVSTARVGEVLTAQARSPRVRATGHAIMASAAASGGRWRAAMDHLRMAEDLDAITAAEHRAFLVLSPLAPQALRRQALQPWCEDGEVGRDGGEDPGGGPMWSQYFDPHRELRPSLRLLLAGLGCVLGDEAAKAVAHARALREACAPDAPPFATSMADWIDAEILRREGEPADALAKARPVVEGVTPTATIASPFYSQPLRRLRYASLLEETGRSWGAVRWLRGLGEVTLFDLPFLPAALLAEGRILAQVGEHAAAREALGRFITLWEGCDPEASQPLREARELLDSL